MTTGYLRISRTQEFTADSHEAEPHTDVTQQGHSRISRILKHIHKNSQQIRTKRNLTPTSQFTQQDIYGSLAHPQEFTADSHEAEPHTDFTVHTTRHLRISRTPARIHSRFARSGTSHRLHSSHNKTFTDLSHTRKNSQQIRTKRNLTPTSQFTQQDIYGSLAHPQEFTADSHEAEPHTDFTVHTTRHLRISRTPARIHSRFARSGTSHRLHSSHNKTFTDLSHTRKNSQQIRTKQNLTPTSHNKTFTDLSHTHNVACHRKKPVRYRQST